MSTPLYEIQGLEHFYGQSLALAIPSLAIAQGAALGLAGPNGSGKSTLLRLLALLETPTRGSLLVEGRPGPEALPRGPGGVTLLLQEPYLLRRSVEDNVAYGLGRTLAAPDKARRVRQALDWVGLPYQDFARRPWFALSGGEAKRVALAARLALRPRVLLLDEPTAGVDAASAALIGQAFLRARREWGSTLVLASHDLFWLHGLAERVLPLYRGRIGDMEGFNVIPGPWQTQATGPARRTLDDGQVILAPAGIPEVACAAVRPNQVRLSLAPPPPAAEMNLLRALVTHLSLDQGTGQVLVGLTLPGLTLLARLDLATAQDLALQPGQQVWAAFPLAEVTWL